MELLTKFLFFIIIILILYNSYKYMTYKPKNFPPGPPRIPIFGSYIFLLIINYKHIHKAVLWLCKYYKTPVLGLYIGNFLAIVANDYNSVRELLFRQEFDGRLDVVAARLRDPHFNLSGIFFTDGQRWREQRRFILRHLRDWGFGRRSEQLENILRDEIYSFIQLLKDGPKYLHEKKYFKNGKILCPEIFYAVMGNSFLSVLYGERLPRSEHEILFKTGNNGMRFQRNADEYGRLFSVIPWLRFIFPNLSGYNTVKEANAGVYNFIKDIIDKQIETFDVRYERHVIDLYIKEMKQAEANEDILTSFTYENLVMACTDFTFPPFTAVSQTLTFLFQRLFLYPECQRKIQDEIDDVVGQGRLPNLDDRKNLSYTEAFIRETMRHETLVPSSIPHRCMTATTFMGYDVPAGTTMIPSLFAASFDTNVWKEPNKFCPERFLDENNRLCLKKDKSFPFGAGKRLCAGETFARNMLFLLTAAIFQNFTVKLPDDERIPDLSKNHTALITHTPEPFYISLIPR